MSSGSDTPVESELDARVRAWLASGDSADLWPQVPAAARLEAHRRVALATSGVLNGKERRRRLEAESDNDARALSVAAFESGMGPLLGFWLEAKLLEADPRAAAVLSQHLQHGRARTAKLDQVLATVLDACGRRDIRAAVLKGSHTRQVHFPEPGTRTGSDIDLLVSRDEFERTCAALRDAGLEETRRTRRPFRSEWVPRGPRGRIHSLELNHADNPWSLDLHINLDRWFSRWVRARLPDPGPTDLTEFPLRGQPARGLAHPALAAYLAINACSRIHEIQLIHLVELVLLARRDAMRGTLNWNALGQLLAETGMERFAYPAFYLAERLAPGTIDRNLLAKLTGAATPRMRRVVDVLQESGCNRFARRSLDEKLMWAASWGQQLGALVESVWPLDDAYTIPERVRFFRRRVRAALGGGVGIRAG